MDGPVLEEIARKWIQIGCHNAIRAAIGTPTPDRLRQVAHALRLGMSAEEVGANARAFRAALPGGAG